MTDDYDFSDDLLDRVFDMSEQLMGNPQQPGEFTRSQMAERYPKYTRKQWSYRLNKMVEEGILNARKGRRNILFYSIAEGAEVDFDDI